MSRHLNRKPPWLRRKINFKETEETQKVLSKYRLSSVCEAGLCPNIAECFSKGQATFMILGRRCTRNCQFCNLDFESPDRIDPAEPWRIGGAVEELGMTHVVITSPTRDDLSDGGASQFVQTIQALRERNARICVEVLIPDFRGNLSALKQVINVKPDILGHNMETVRRLYFLRHGADYQRSIEIIAQSKKIQPALKTKSGLMLGLGESKSEVIELLADLRRAGCDFLTIGQYLAPSVKHYPVVEYIAPEIFNDYRIKALELGFEVVMSSPYTRSSHRAGEFLC